MNSWISTALITLMTGAAATPSQAAKPDDSMVKRAKTVALAHGIDLSEYESPVAGKLSDGVWGFYFKHMQRYQGKQPIYLLDDCFSVIVDDATGRDTYFPCP